jgi:Family of unknown function (DUF5317)
LDDDTMLTVYICAATLLAVAGTGGRLKRLAQVPFRHAWLLWAALAVQILIMSIIPESRPAFLSGAHIGSYLAAGAFLLINRRLPGVWLIGAGGVLNCLVITINGGTLPASATALQQSGLHVSTDEFNNSAVLAHPHLPMLGDVFATPSWLPGSNVFSIGDVAVWLGVIWFLWRICQPRPAPGHTPRHQANHRNVQTPGRSPWTAAQGRAVQYTPTPLLAPAHPVTETSRRRTPPATTPSRPARHRR